MQKKLIKFFTSYFCPYAQMVQIAFNEAGPSVLDQIEYVEGLKILPNGEYDVHPDLLALGRKFVPTVYYKNQVLIESRDLIRYIDKEFAQKPFSMVPQEEKLRNYVFEQEDYIRNKLIQSFYQILIKQDVQIQEQAKENFTQQAFNIIQNYKGPYYLGDFFSNIDITIAPYFQRMIVLKKYRDFTIPQTSEFQNWHDWKANVLRRKCVADSIIEEDKIIGAYKRYAQNTAKNQHTEMINSNKWKTNNY